jgi:SAM-dependent methyltransferase
VADPDQLKQTFELVPELYDKARPRYPDELFDDLVDLAGLEANSRLLEIACGTGKATVPLAERGYAITSIEMGSSLAAVARRNLATYPKVRVTVASFEEWEAAVEPFDLLYVASAWHWLDPELRYGKAASLLYKGGTLAFFNAVHAFPADVDPFFLEVQEVYEAIGLGSQEHWIPGHDRWPPPLPNDVPDQADEVLASGYFEDVKTRRYVWGLDYNADEYLELLNTFSGHIAMEADKRDYLYSEIRRRIDQRPGGSVRRHWLSVMHVARRS